MMFLNATTRRECGDRGEDAREEMTSRDKNNAGVTDVSVLICRRMQVYRQSVVKSQAGTNSQYDVSMCIFEVGKQRKIFTRSDVRWNRASADTMTTCRVNATMSVRAKLGHDKFLANIFSEEERQNTCFHE